MKSTRSTPGQEHLKKGDIVIIPYDETDNGDTKDRPHLIVWEAETDTYAVCPITSKPNREHKIPLERKDMQSGGLNYDPSYIRPNLISTYKREEDWRKVGTLKENKMTEVTEKIKSIAEQAPREAPRSNVLQRPPAR